MYPEISGLNLYLPGLQDLVRIQFIFSPIKKEPSDLKNQISPLVNYFLGAFFLPATVLRFPLRVRLLVRVR